MTTPVFDFPTLDGARARETVVRLAIAGAGSGETLCAVVENWLRRKAGFLELMLSAELGRHGDRNAGGEIEVDRSTERLVAFLSEKDVNLADRRWTTEIQAERDGTRLDVRVMVEQPLTAPYAPRQTPRFVADVVADTRIGITDVVALGPVPRAVPADDITQLVALVDDERRRLPVVAVSIPAAIDPAELARRLAGAAHVVTLDSDASYMLTEQIGKFRSVFHGGVRIYPAGFRWADSPRQAPLWLGARLAEIHEGLPAQERVVRHVLARTAQWLAGRGLLTIGDVDRQARLRDERVTDVVRDDVAALEHEIEVVRAERDALAAKADEEAFYLDISEGENRFLREQLGDAEEVGRVARAAEFRWRSELEALRTANIGEALALPPGAVAPGDGDAFAAFVEDRYRGHVVVSPRAKRYYSRGEYEDLEKLVAVLDAIALHYRDRERGVAGAHERWEEACAALHVKQGWSATETGADDDHRLQWNSANRLMYHIRSNGTTFDPRRMLYVGFVFDDTTQQVVLGRLPSKPPTMADHT